MSDSRLFFNGLLILPQVSCIPKFIQIEQLLLDVLSKSVSIFLIK